MMVNRTFSKAFGLAGLRIGYILCDPALASYFNRVRFPWNVSQIAIAAALAAIQDMADQQRKRQNIIAGRNYIFTEINKFPGFKAFPSEGNFVLIDASTLGEDSLAIRDRMAEKGIFIRPMSGHNMARGFIRITVGTPEQNRLFIQTFKEYIREIRGNKAGELT
jgi:histidinol-phosphate aminotransferase